VPTLAQQIVLGNKAGGDPQINFAGVFDGNPYTNNPENQRGEYETLGGHQMVSRPVYAAWMSACSDGNTSSVACNNARNSMRNDVGNNIDPYAIDWPVCTQRSKYNEIYLFYKYQQESGNDNIRAPAYYADMIDYFNKYPDKEWYIDPNGLDAPDIITTDGFPYDPCEENYMTSYLNQAAVQQAIHVVPKHWPGTQIHYQGGLPDMTVVWQWVIDNTPSPLHLNTVTTCEIY